jgi:hypothetical protein
MSLKRRAIWFFVVFVIVSLACGLWQDDFQPTISTNLAIQQVNGGDASAAALRSFEHGKAAMGSLSA